MPRRPVGEGSQYLEKSPKGWNYILICVPVTFLVRFTQGFNISVFATAFLGLLSTAKIFKLAMEDLTMRVTPHAGIVIQVFMGNIIELISGIIAIKGCKLGVLQASVVGSVLINILLVLGVACKCFSGGTKFAEQGYSPNHAHSTSHLLMLGTLATLLPSIFAPNGGGTTGDTEKMRTAILWISRVFSLCLLLCYIIFGVYQFCSHTSAFEASMPSTRYPQGGDDHSVGAQSDISIFGNRTETSSYPLRERNSGRCAVSDSERGQVSAGDTEEADEESKPSMHLLFGLVVLIGTGVLIYFLSEFVVGSLADLTHKLPLITEQWVGLILIPLAGTFSRHDVLEAVAFGRNDKMNSSLVLSLGSSLNISLFIQPFLVLLAWIMQTNLTLLYDPLETWALFLSVLFVNFVVQPGQSNWFCGVSLLVLYLLIAIISFWIYTDDRVVSSLVFACKG
ncbi:Calcium/proton exchanger [Mycena venus]|uniref:Calcium/proton exchanger n=1 Tax=Mycena venus TaxID=2733690 RepID=A0A8H7CJ77_9AGAR|nr:Calcium/proton exchanger [Mycena venus]